MKRPWRCQCTWRTSGPQIGRTEIGLRCLFSLIYATYWRERLFIVMSDLLNNLPLSRKRGGDIVK